MKFLHALFISSVMSINIFAMEREDFTRANDVTRAIKDTREPGQDYSTMSVAARVALIDLYTRKTTFKQYVETITGLAEKGQLQIAPRPENNASNATSVVPRQAA